MVGHSLGGCVAQAVAATVPDKVVRLLVVEALGWFSHDGEMACVRARACVHVMCACLCHVCQVSGH